MLTGRRYGGTPDMSAPPRTTRPALGVSNPAEQPHQRGLAAAGRTEQAEEPRSKMSSLTSSTARRAEALGHALEADQGHGARSFHGAK